MLELRVESCEGCDQFAFNDLTGTYDPDTNPTGYGTENGVTSPAAFDTYTLSVWYPQSDTSGDPDFTYDLLEDLPTPDSDGYYQWEITAASMGLTALKSGVYTMTATGILGIATYMADAQTIFVRDLKKTVIDPMMLDFDPSCGCKPGCEDPSIVFAQYLTVACAGICDAVKAQRTITDLYTKQSCC